MGTIPHLRQGVPHSALNPHAKLSILVVSDMVRRLQRACAAMVRKSLCLAAVVLAAFHIWLFAGQLWTGELVDLALASRWIIAASLVAALLGLRHRGLSLLASRHAVAVWLLAVLLHGPALTRDLDGVSPSMPEVVATLAQTVSSFALVGTMLLMLFALRTRRAAAALQAVQRLDAPFLIGALPPRSFQRFAPRPPPTIT